MKRDMELVRKLLFYLEEQTVAKFQECEDIHIDGFDSSQIGHHLVWMYQGGLLSGEISRSSSTPERIISVYPFDLTWKGHEFLNDVRDSVVWIQAKKVSKSIQSASFQIIWDLAKAIIRKKLNDATDGEYTI